MSSPLKMVLLEIFPNFNGVEEKVELPPPNGEML